MLIASFIKALINYIVYTNSGPTQNLRTLGVCVCLLRCLIYKVQPFRLIRFSLLKLQVFRLPSSSFASMSTGLLLYHNQFPLSTSFFKNFFSFLSSRSSSAGILVYHTVSLLSSFFSKTFRGFPWSFAPAPAPFCSLFPAGLSVASA